MRLSDLTDPARLIDQAGDAAGRLFETDVRLGITGLRRSGKTVFTTALVDNLLRAGRLPFLDVMQTNRFQAARLRPQPDQDVPRFELERHMASLTAAEPHWPEPTRGISQLRLALRFRPGSALRRAVRRVATVNLDIIDYPGEWLLDLPMLRQSFAEWSAQTLDLARRPPRDGLSAAWRGWADAVDPAAPAEEDEARRGAALYTAYLHDCRRADPLLSLIQPGRFVEPGDMQNAPLLTFCPLPGGRRGRGSLWALMEERYDAYLRQVVRRFFGEHFARLDRQIVLVDVLGALNAGPAAVADMKLALSTSLDSFRHGSAGWLDWLFGSRIDRVLFAVTKADHVAAHQHTALRGLLDSLVAEASTSIRFDGARVETMAIASVKCTETVETQHDGRTLRCIKGIPVGRDKPTVLFPGELPDGGDALRAAEGRSFGFLPFRPPPGIGRDGRGVPHVRLDQALQFLIGDHLA